MNISSGFLRFTLVAFGLTGVGTLAAMALFASSRPEYVNWWVLLVTAGAFVTPLWCSSAHFDGDCTITAYWKRASLGPTKAFFITVGYALGAVATGVWAVQHVAPNASVWLILFMMLPPFFTGWAGWLFAHIVGFALAGFRQ